MNLSGFHLREPCGNQGSVSLLNCLTDMDAEFIVVSGPLLGARFPLGTGELRIGRAPAAEIRLTEPDAAWDHCLVRPRDGRYHLLDRRTGAGTYVNGMRITEHALEPDDQVSIGETVLVYREDPAVIADSPNHMLLRACSLLSSVRLPCPIAPPADRRYRPLRRRRRPPRPQ